MRTNENGASGSPDQSRSHNTGYAHQGVGALRLRLSRLALDPSRTLLSAKRGDKMHCLRAHGGRKVWVRCGWMILIPHEWGRHRLHPGLTNSDPVICCYTGDLHRVAQLLLLPKFYKRCGDCCEAYVYRRNRRERLCCLCLGGRTKDKIGEGIRSQPPRSGARRRRVRRVFAREDRRLDCRAATLKCPKRGLAQAKISGIS